MRRDGISNMEQEHSSLSDSLDSLVCAVRILAPYESLSTVSGFQLPAASNTFAHVQLNLWQVVMCET